MAQCNYLKIVFYSKMTRFFIIILKMINLVREFFNKNIKNKYILKIKKNCHFNKFLIKNVKKC